MYQSGLARKVGATPVILIREFHLGNWLSRHWKLKRQKENIEINTEIVTIESSSTFRVGDQ
jgi:hypothetical protein